MINVKYNYGGKHYLVQFWTEWEQHQIVLARSLSAMNVTLDRLFEENSDLKIKQAFEVEIVAPPLELEAYEHAYRMRSRIYEFWHRSMHKIRTVYQRTGWLPPIFEPCSEFVPKLLRDGEPADEDEHHRACKACDGKLRLLGMTREQFYERYARPVEFDPDDPRTEVAYLFDAHYDVRAPQSFDFRAPRAPSKEGLCLAYDDFGHHSYGLRIGPIGEPSGSFDTIESYECYGTPNYIDGNVAFFYLRGSDLDMTEIHRRIESRKQEKKRLEKESRRTQKARFEAQYDRERQALERIFLL